jgi:hypothetical protein
LKAEVKIADPLLDDLRAAVAVGFAVDCIDIDRLAGRFS